MYRTEGGIRTDNGTEGRIRTTYRTEGEDYNKIEGEDSGLPTGQRERGLANSTEGED